MKCNANPARLATLVLTMMIAVSSGTRSLDAQDASVDAPTTAAEEKEEPAIEDIRVVIKTSKGVVAATLFAGKAPVTVANFLNLSRRDYYDGVTFHRVVPGFVVQGGDPTGSGSGGPGYFIENEIHAELRHDKAGILSMARKRQPDTNGSQFFITLDETPHLDEGYSVFGEVTKGQDVVDAIEQGDVIEDVEILDDAEPLFETLSDRVAEWNRILEAAGR